MTDFNNTPTAKFYGVFQMMFDHYNTELFEGKISNCIIVITRKAHVFGHYSPKRWYNTDTEDTDELALNPNMFTKYHLLEICQTVVHEMVHAWQFHLGFPSKGSTFKLTPT